MRLDNSTPMQDCNILIYCPVCHDLKWSRYFGETKMVHLDCEDCGAVYEIDLKDTNLHQPEPE